MNYRIRRGNENMIDKRRVAKMKQTEKERRGDCRSEGQLRSLQNKKTLLPWQLPSCELSLACMFTHPHTEETNTHLCLHRHNSCTCPEIPHCLTTHLFCESSSPRSSTHSPTDWRPGFSVLCQLYVWSQADTLLWVIASEKQLKAVVVQTKAK